VGKQGPAASTAAFEVFFRSFRPNIERIARSILRSDDEVDDVVQEIFVIAYLRLHELRDEKALKSWISTVTVREVLRMRKRRMKQFGVGVPCDAADFERGDPFTEGRLEDDLLAGDLTRAVGKLSPGERRAWSLRVQGYSLDEVSAECGCSLATTKRRISGASEKLRAFLSPYRAALEEPV